MTRECAGTRDARPHPGRRDSRAKQISTWASQLCVPRGAPIGTRYPNVQDTAQRSTDLAMLMLVSASVLDSVSVRRRCRRRVGRRRLPVRRHLRSRQRRPRRTQVFVYPTSGQSPEQLEPRSLRVLSLGREAERLRSRVRPRWPCISALRSSPCSRLAPTPWPVQLLAPCLGAVIAGPRDAGGGAIVGGVIGGAAGAASDAQRQERVNQVQRRYDDRENARMAKLEEQASNYRRALTACLEGRGYTVK